MKNILKIIVLAGLLTLIVSPIFAVAKADNNGNGKEKCTILHYTGSETNPYEEIIISQEGWFNGHINHVGDVAIDGPCFSGGGPN